MIRLCTPLRRNMVVYGFHMSVSACWVPESGFAVRIRALVRGVTGTKKQTRVNYIDTQAIMCSGQHLLSVHMCTIIRPLRETLPAYLTGDGPGQRIVIRDFRFNRGKKGNLATHLIWRCFDSMCRLTRCFLEV